MTPDCLADQAIAEASWCEARTSGQAVVGNARTPLPTVRPPVADSAAGELAGAALGADTTLARRNATGNGTSNGHGQAWRLISARVTDATRVTDHLQGDYTAYHVEVDVAASVEGSDDDGPNMTGQGAEWALAEAPLHMRQLERRFSDFTHLDQSLRNAGLSHAIINQLPTLPSSLTFNKFSDSVIHTRRMSLDRYVRALLSTDGDGRAVLASLPEVEAFFGGEGDVVNWRVIFFHS